MLRTHRLTNRDLSVKAGSGACANTDTLFLNSAASLVGATHGYGLDVAERASADKHCRQWLVGPRRRSRTAKGRSSEWSAHRPNRAIAKPVIQNRRRGNHVLSERRVPRLRLTASQSPVCGPIGQDFIGPSEAACTCVRKPHRTPHGCFLLLLVDNADLRNESPLRYDRSRRCSP